MRIDGQWLVGDDGVMRPVISGEILAAHGAWEKSEFLVDTGTDRTVFSAATLARLGLQPLTTHEGLSGVGGIVTAVIVDTRLRLTYEDAGKVVFRGQYAALTTLEALDISVLGRDITGLFAMIVDRPLDVVCLLGQRHRYSIEQDWRPGRQSKESDKVERHFFTVLDQTLARLHSHGRVTYTALKLQFHLDDAHLAALKEELLYTHPEVVDDAGRGLLWNRCSALTETIVLT